MNTQIAPSKPFAIGRMTATERAAGRFMRNAEGHAPAAPVIASAEPAPVTAVPVTPPASIMAAAEPAAPAAPQRPEGLPDAFWDDAAGIKPEAYSRLAELEAADVARREGVPASAAEYSLDLPEPVVGLDGKPLTIDAADPLAVAILPALHEAGVPQAAVSKIVQAYAASEVAAARAEAAELATAQAEAFKTFNAPADAVAKRTGATHAQVTAAIGAAPAEAIRTAINTAFNTPGAAASAAAATLAIEALVAKIQAPAIGAAPLQAPATPDIATRLYG